MARRRGPASTIGAGAGEFAAGLIGAATGLGTSAGQIATGAVTGGPNVTLVSTDPGIIVIAKLRSPVARPIARPKVDIVDRPGMVGLTQWSGRDPYQVTLPIMFDGLAPLLHGNQLGDGNRSVERQIDDLNLLALVHKGHDDTPVIHTVGPVPNPTGINSPRWRVYGMTEIPERTIFNANGACTRWAVDLVLIEHVRDDVLASSLSRVVNSPAGATYTHTVKTGETTLFKVASNLYHDGSKAKDIAEANDMKVTAHLKPGQKLRIP